MEDNYPYIIIFDTKFTNITRNEACDLIEGYIHENMEFYLIEVKDVSHVVRCKEDKFLDTFYTTIPKNIFVDGRCLVYFSYLLRKPLKEMVGGPGIYLEMLRRSEKNNYKIYYLGASEFILNKAVENVKKRHRGISIVGKHNGYFNEDEEKQIVENINNSNCDILFVGITTPKSEQFIKRNIQYFRNMVCIPVGGMFDVESGEKKLAPKIIGYMGLEWLYRVIQEPRRLFKRYFHAIIKIFYYFIRELIKFEH